MTDTNTEDLSQFRQLCGVNLLVDHEGKNPILCVDVNWAGQNYKRCVHLSPLIKWLADGIRAYHDALHKEAITGEFIGAGSKTRKRKSRGRGRTRTPSARHPSRSRHVEDTSYETYPEEYTHPDDYQYARQSQAGYQNPYAPQSFQPSQQLQYETLEDMRSAGQNASRDWSQPYNPYGFTESEYTPPGTDLLQVQGWSDTIKKMARELAESKAVKSLYHDLKKAAKNKNVQRAALATAFGPAAIPLLDAAYKVHDVVVNAREGDENAKERLIDLRDAAESGNKAAELSFNAAQNINEQLNDKEESAEAETNQFVQGWLYNSPYRTVSQMVTAPLRKEFPSIGMFMRDAWHEGLEFAGTMKRRPLFKLGA